MKIALIGAGAIGGYLKEKTKADASLELTGIFDIDEARRTVNSIEELLATNPDLVVEAAGFEAVRDYAEKILKQTNLLMMSATALAYEETRNKMDETCKKNGTRYLIPSGAIIGIDGIKAAKEQIESALLVTRKNPKGFGREDKEETVLFDGSAREACKKFPRNVNVSATLSLNGIGFDKTRVKILSDPKTIVNNHTITVGGAFGKFTIKVENSPSKNPKTSALAGMSAFTMIKEIQSFK